MIHNASYHYQAYCLMSYGAALISYPSFFCSLLIEGQHIIYPHFLFYLLRLLLFISYSLHCDIKTGNTFLVIGNSKLAIHDEFKGRKSRSLRSILDPSLQEDSAINNLAANNH